MSSKQYAFTQVDRIEVTLPVFSESFDKKWVSFGTDNLYPDFIISLFNKSAINRTCIIAKTEAVCGQGLSFEDETKDYLLKRANPTASWNDVLDKVALDYNIFGGFAINVIWSKDGTKIAEFYPLDYSKVRSTPVNPDTDKADSYWYCSDWTNPKKFKPVSYPTFDPSKAIEEPSQILVYFDYSPGATVYPLPSYSGSINDIQIDIEVSKFHISSLANGLAPSLVISLQNGIPETDEERTEIYDEITSAYRGTENASKMMLMFSEDSDHAPVITPIEAANSDYYVVLDKRITSRILSGHRITSPMLLGLYSDGTGFSSNADEIIVAYEHFVATVIKPMQKSILKVFNTVLYYTGETKLELQIVPNRIISAPAATEAVA